MIKLRKAQRKEAQSATVLVHDHRGEAIKSLPVHRVHASVFEEDKHHEDHPDHTYEKAIFSWIAPEYLQHPKSSRWWMIAAIIFMIIAIGEYFTGNWTMLVATIVFAMVYVYIHEFHPPKYTKVTISNFGIKVGHRRIPYADLVAFWIFYDPPRVKTLNLRINKGVFCDLAIELEDQDPVAIRETLLRQIPEWEGKKEQMSDIILRLLKL